MICLLWLKYPPHEEKIRRLEEYSVILSVCLLFE